jgi:hypothetical protein
MLDDAPTGEKNRVEFLFFLLNYFNFMICALSLERYFKFVSSY